MNFPELILKEADNLKKYATREELNKLRARSLYAESSTNCIYGLMTGYCHSPRAEELILLSCEKVYISGKGEAVCDNVELNGKPIKGKRGGLDGYWSPIEVFISQNEQDENEELNEQLIDYLKK